jgi:HAD superfamily hydrolase (TIGR01509 family)
MTRSSTRPAHGPVQCSVPFSALILDFDGLIIDSETPLLQIWQEIYTQHGGTLTLDEWQAALGTHRGFDPYAELERQTGTALARDHWTEHVRLEHRRRCEFEPLQPGVLERLEEARAEGLPTAVASSSTRAWVEPWLQCHRIDALVDVVCTRDDVTRVKPAPDLFLLAAERLATPPEACVVFEDSPNGLRAARAANMWVVAVPRGLTRDLSLPEPDAVLESLAACTLAELRGRLDRVRAGQAR